MNALTRRTRRLAGIGAGIVMSVLAVASVGAQTDVIVQAITGGEQPTITIQSISLAPTSYSADEQYNPGQIGYTISAASGTAPGWSVNVQAGDLIYSGEHGGINIPAANLSVSSANAPLYVSGDAIDASNGPFVPAEGATGGLNTPRTVLTANPGYGDGVYSQDLDLTLTIPGESKPGNYSGTITFSTNAAP